jgi:hypothetical protein
MSYLTTFIVLLQSQNRDKRYHGSNLVQCSIRQSAWLAVFGSVSTRDLKHVFVVVLGTH